MAKPKKWQGDEPASYPWVVVVATAFRIGVDNSLSELYAKIGRHPRTKANPHWRDKVRQVLQRYPYFKRVERGVWALKPGALSELLIYRR